MAKKPFEIKLFDSWEHKWIKIEEGSHYEDIEAAVLECDRLNKRDSKHMSPKDYYGVIDTVSGECIYPVPTPKPEPKQKSKRKRKNTKK